MTDDESLKKEAMKMAETHIPEEHKEKFEEAKKKIDEKFASSDEKVDPEIEAE